MPRRVVSLALAPIVLIVGMGSARAQDDTPQVVRAREAFVQGTTFAQDMRWGDALGRFEASARLRPHAGTSYNIGICQRALGQYVRARKSFLEALARNDQESGAALADSMVADIRTYIAEVERVLATLDVSLEPATATITVDGRPLEPTKSQDGVRTLLAGTLAAGSGAPPPSARFRLVLDPGTHVFVLSRDGFSDVVRRVTVNPGSHGTLPLVLERLPGVLRIESNVERAVVTVDELDVGTAPVTLQRGAGRYRVVVRKKGFVTYETQAELSAGGRVDLRAVMKPEEIGVTRRWWFWTAVGVVVVGTAVGTYYASRPDPEQPPLDGGGLGWTVRVP